jgi:hypothetical protein
LASIDVEAEHASRRLACLVQLHGFDAQLDGIRVLVDHLDKVA